jgi:hypothetical protein
LDTEFIEHFNTQLAITFNYSAIADFHALPIIPAHAKSFPACSVFTIRLLVTASNNGYSSASVLKSSLNGDSLPTTYSYSSCPPYNPSVRITVGTSVSNNSSIVVHGNLFICDRCPETALHAIIWTKKSEGKMAS